MLRHQRHRSPAFPGAERCHVPPGDEHGPARGRQGQRPEQAGLAGAVGSLEGDDLAGRDLERHLVNNQIGPAAHTQATDARQRRPRRPRRQRHPRRPRRDGGRGSRREAGRTVGRVRGAGDLTGPEPVRPVAAQLEPGIRRTRPLARVVFGDDDAHPRLVGEALEQPADPDPGRGVQVGQRLVDQEQDRPGGQGGADGHQARLSRRQRVHLPVEQVLDPQPAGDLPRPLVDDDGGHAAHGQGESDLVPHVFGHEGQPHVLADHPDETGGVARGSPGAVRAAHGDPACLAALEEMLEQAAQAVQQAGLARPGRPGDHGERAGLELEVQPGEVPVAPAVAVAGIGAVLPRVAEAERGIRHHGGPLAGAVDHVRGGETAGLHRGGEGEGSLDRLFEDGNEQGRDRPLTAAQPAGHPHPPDRVEQGRERGPGDHQGTGDRAQRTAPGTAGEEPAHVHHGVEHPEDEDQRRDRQGAQGGIRQAAGGDRPEQGDLAERPGQRNPREVQQQEAGTGCPGEENPVARPQQHEAHGEERRGAQGSRPETEH